jgi:hypothetical protein
MKKIFFLILFGCLLTFSNTLAQNYPTGAIIDVDLYNSIPRKAIQLSRNYSNIPSVYSMKQYAPIPNSQRYGTCTAWASAYAARTIAESIALNRTDRFLTTQNVFSPMFVYKTVFLINYNDPNPSGVRGISIYYALNLLKNEGAVRMPNFEMNMPITQILLSYYSGYRRYPIADFQTLYASWTLLARDGDPIRTRMVKKSISEGKPVVIAIKCPQSFQDARNTDVWYPYPNEDPITYEGSAHALCVVGYDDNKYGGAFEIQNSWGITDWGNRGYIWIPYSVFDKWAYEAYDMTENLSNYETIEFSGFVQIEVYNSNQGMPVRFNGEYYQTINSYQSGTSFRYLIGNNKPSYVYAFAGDSGTTRTTRIFPPEDQNISPILDYNENVVAFPGEATWVQLDDNVGVDYLIVLYAKEALEIDRIRQRFESTRGSLPERVSAAVGSNFISARNANYNTDEIRFSAVSANPKAVFGLLLAINHHAR